MRRGPLLIAATCLSALVMGGTAQAVHDPQEPAPLLELSEGIFSFPKQQVGTVSPPKAVTLTARCNADHDAEPGGPFTPVPGRCTEATLDLAVSGPFAIAGGTCPALLTGFRRCEVHVAYLPSARGSQSGFLRIVSNPIRGVQLSGSGCRQRKTKDGSRKCKAVKRKPKRKKRKG
jgi:hypothetical protein